MKRWSIASFVILAACAKGRAPEAPAPGGAPAEVTRAALPPIPVVNAPLRLDVAYPPENSAVAVRDSNFIFGSTGTGGATLTINNTPVEVKPNGAWLAYLPVPPDGVYRLQATKGTETASLDRRVRIPAAVVAPSGPSIVRGSVMPSGAVAVRVRENVEVSFRGTPGGRAFVVLPSKQRYPLVESRVASQAVNNAADFQTTPQQSQTAAPPTTVRYSGVFPAESIRARDSNVELPQIGELPAQMPVDSSNAYARVELIIGSDTIRAPLDVNLTVIDLPRVGVAVDRSAGGPHRAWRIRGRPTLGGPFHYFWDHGTMLTLTGQRGNFYRVQLAGDMTAWVPTADVQLLPVGAAPPGGPIASARFAPGAGYVDFYVSLPARLPYQVEETDRNVLQLDIYGGVSQVNFMQFGKLDPLISRAQWTQPRDSVFRVNIELSQAVWGYDIWHAPTGNLVLRIRRPPAIDPDRPLRGLTILVDPGHGGRDTATIGPTRLPEAHANLAIALRLEPLLSAAGAHVVMTRRTNVFIELAERTQMAVDSNAHILVSVHNNAFPEGVNPFVNNGTSTYFYHPHSIDLAQSLERELLRELGLRDIGYGRADLALVRPTWMPAALTETSFMMVPEQEAGLRNPDWLERIARAHLRGIEAFVRGRARVQ